MRVPCRDVLQFVNSTDKDLSRPASQELGQGQG